MTTAYPTKYGKGLTYIRDTDGVYKPLKGAWQKTGATTWTPVTRANVKVDANTWVSVYPTPQGNLTPSSTSISLSPYRYHTAPDNDLDGNVSGDPYRLTVTNTGDYDLIINRMSYQSATSGYDVFVTDPNTHSDVTTPYTLVPGEYRDFGVRVRGLTVGTYTEGNITFTNDIGHLGNTTTVVPLSVSVLANYPEITVTPKPVQLPYYVLESPATQTLTIRNSGNGANLIISNIRAQNGRVTLGSNPGTIGYDFTNFSGNTATVLVTAANLARGTYSDTIIVTSNALTYPTLQIPVTITVSQPNGVQAFTSPGTYTWTVPAHVKRLSMLAVGAGAGGGPAVWYPGVSKGGGGGGGGSGATTASYDLTVTPGETITVTVGDPGGTNNISNRQFFPVSLSYAWNAFMNSYAVWMDPSGVRPVGELVLSRRLFTASASGIYTFEAAADNYVEVYVDGVPIVITGSFTSTVTEQSYLAQGNRALAFYARNDGGPAGFALTIKDPGGNIVWHTRTQLDPSVGNPGGSTVVTGSFGTITTNSGAGGGSAYDDAPATGGGESGYGGGGESTGDASGGGGGGGCFLPFTLIRMADGTEKQISQIKSGDLVLEALTNQPARVIGVKTREHDVSKWVFAVHDNETPYMTEEHPWYNDDDELCAISTLCTEQAPWLGPVNIVDVKNKIKLAQEVIVYNLMLETGESHYANGIRVNNIIKTGTAYVLLHKGYLSQAAYENYVYNTANKAFAPEKQVRIFNALHKISRYILDNDTWKSRLLARAVAWAITNRSTVEPIVKWIGDHPRIRNLLFGKLIK
jgi:hypothetical protein